MLKGKSKCPNCEIEVEIDSFIKGKGSQRSCPRCGFEGKEILVIDVVKMPEGTAPAVVKEGWFGCRFPAEVLGGEATDLTMDEEIDSEKVYLVSAPIAIEILEEKSREAADWITMFTPRNLKYVCFRRSETKVIARTIIFDYLLPEKT